MNNDACIPQRRISIPYPARSKMLDGYATDIAILMSEGFLDSAERSALSIPHISVALSDAGLLSSWVAYRDWCAAWVQPVFGAQVYGQWCVRSGECIREQSEVPFLALRSLRLRRQARDANAKFDPVSSLTEQNDSQAIACALLGAASRWYEEQGRFDRTVQTNLARLGVLR